MSLFPHRDAVFFFFVINPNIFPNNSLPQLFTKWVDLFVGTPGHALTYAAKIYTVLYIVLYTHNFRTFKLEVAKATILSNWQK